MRVLVLVDSPFAQREQHMLDRLEVGLASEGARVLHAVPEQDQPATGEGIFARAIRFPTPGLIAGRRATINALRSELDRALGDEGQDEVRVVHAFGGRVWTIACELARSIGAVAALEVWRGGLVDRAVALASTQHAEHGPVFLAPDRAVVESLRTGRVEPTTRLVPWGVHTASHPRTILPPGRPPTIMLYATGRDPRACAAAIEAIATRVRENPDLLVFVQAQAVERAGLWPLAHRLGILANLSVIQGMEIERSLITRGDVLLYPEALGEHRTLLLEAMGAGMAVVAPADPVVEAIIPDRTARVPVEPTRQGFEETLASVLDDPAEANRLGASARDFIAQHRKASAQVGAVIDAYEWMCSKDAVPIRRD